MKNWILYALLILYLSACKKDKEEEDLNPPNKPVLLQGGKGGDYSFAVFTRNSSIGINSRIWIKYASKTAPSDTSKYDEGVNSMVEPGFGPHAHFSQLQKGSYYIYALSRINNTDHADTVIVIGDSSSKSFDFDLILK